MSLLQSAKNYFAPEKEKEWYEEIEENVCSLCPALSWQQRIYGCVICVIIGFCLSMGSVFRLMELLRGNPVPFAVMYTVCAFILNLITLILSVTGWKYRVHVCNLLPIWPILTSEADVRVHSLHYYLGVLLLHGPHTLLGLLSPVHTHAAAAPGVQHSVPVHGSDMVMLCIVLLCICNVAYICIFVRYTISFIPFARDFVMKFFRECCCDCNCCGGEGTQRMGIGGSSSESWF